MRPLSFFPALLVVAACAPAAAVRPARSTPARPAQARVAPATAWAEDDPRAWVDRVGDAGRQREAIVRLGTMLTGTEPAQHADEAIAMLAKGHVEGRWDDVTARAVLRLVAESGSELAAPALTRRCGRRSSTRTPTSRRAGRPRSRSVAGG